jgi:hypothetical protein
VPDDLTITVSNPRCDFEVRCQEGLHLVERARVAVVCMYLAQDCEAGTDVSIATQP